MAIETRKIVTKITHAASEKKALDIVTIDMRKLPTVCDYFVIASGTSTTHVRAIADSIIDKLKESGERPWHVEGEREALWMLIDYGDVVVHVFGQDTRKYYDLEKLWSDAPQKRYKEERKVKKVIRKPAGKKARKTKPALKKMAKSVKKLRKSRKK